MAAALAMPINPVVEVPQLVVAEARSVSNQSRPKVALYRWNFRNDWCDAVDAETDRFLELGYTHRTYICKVFSQPVDGTVALNRWNLTKIDDWVSVLETASADMERFGYRGKKLLGYIYVQPRANTQPINRWNLPATGDWVTVPESASADMERFGYTNKTLIGYAPL
ncbi:MULTISPECIES: hypothetical protein [unclassified Spirosoma]|uniref:hypothetical protein n=1 Tax=unclassified Spirosoma TaxID=2621999 RepID=UPI001AC2788F|nr:MULTISPECIES: hypothetical protein [unclassified Spirosoma]MBN8826961.1 hypothetical protein [Spirosoma sp.]